MASKVWDEIIDPFPNFNVWTAVKLEMEQEFHPTL